MKVIRYSAVSLLLLTVSIVNAQPVFNVSDNFDNNNRYSWWIGDSGGGSQHIRNGKLYTDTPESGWALAINPLVEPEKDFKLEATITEKSGIEDHGYGVMWGYRRSDSDQNYFAIAGTGYYYISNTKAEREKKVTGLNEWVKTDLVKPMGTPNVLRVEQKNNVLTFYINDQKVSTMQAFKWAGRGIGITNYAKMSLETDDFKFEQNLKINLPANLTKGLSKENLGASINTASDDLMPIISSDGRQLYFGRENYEGNMGGKEDGEDFYVSEFDGQKWGVAKNLGAPVNSTGVNNILSVSSDNNRMFFISGSKFYSRSRSGSGWGTETEIGLSYVNEAKHFEGFLSPDGKAMFMTVKNSSNLYYDKDIEERDIYVSLLDRDGKWGTPINLGKNINSRSDEYSPFLAADGKTLYFSTEGRPTFGGIDVFMSKRLDDTWKNWTEPVNLGPEINSSGFDAYYNLPASGDYAYIVVDESGFGKADIARIKLTKELKPDPVVLVRGKTLDAKTKQPIAAEILIDNLATGTEVGEAISDAQTGDYKIVLPYGANYGFHAAAKGHLSVNENLELVSISQYTELEKNLYLLPIVQGQTLALNNVFFEQAKAILKPESFPELDRLVAIMRDNPTMEIELGGYTDNIGRPESLIVLSMDRAGMVKKYMVDKGIAARRITGKGYGSSNPVVKNDTEEHRRMNHRVEFKITKK